MTFPAGEAVWPTDSSPHWDADPRNSIHPRLGSRFAAQRSSFSTVVANVRVPQSSRRYLLDADRGDSEPLEASLKYLVQARASENIVFAAHLGDMVENAAAPELAEAGRVMRILDRHRLPYSVLAGTAPIWTFSGLPGTSRCRPLVVSLLAVTTPTIGCTPVAAIGCLSHSTGASRPAPR